MKFWELEEISTDAFHSSEETLAEKHFFKTFRRDDDGRFIVSVPLKDFVKKLGSNQEFSPETISSNRKEANR